MPRMSGRFCRTWCSTSAFASTAMEIRPATRTAIRAIWEVFPILRQLWILLITRPLFRPDTAIFSLDGMGGRAAALRVQSGRSWRWEDGCPRRDRIVRRQLPCPDRRADFPVLPEQLHCVRTKRHCRARCRKRLCLRAGIRAGRVGWLRAWSQLQSDLKRNSLRKGYRSLPPNYTTTPSDFHGARYLEFSMQVQRQITPTDAVIVSYAGNHGYDLFVRNNHLNQNFGPQFLQSFQGPAGNIAGPTLRAGFEFQQRCDLEL